jgi:hypothetical protein
VYTVDLELPLGTSPTIVLHLSEPAGWGSPIVLRQPLVRPLNVTIDKPRLQLSCRKDQFPRPGFGRRRDRQETRHVRRLSVDRQVVLPTASQPPPLSSERAI